MAGGGREAQAIMEETDKESLLQVEAYDSWPSRKEHLEIRCEISLYVQLASYLERGPLMWMMPLHLHVNH